MTAIRDAIREERAITCCLINYTKGGRRFHNLFHLAPVLDAGGRTCWFVGVQTEVTPQQAFELCRTDSGDGAELCPGESPASATLRGAAPGVATQASALTSLLAREADALKACGRASSSAAGTDGEGDEIAAADDNAAGGEPVNPAVRPLWHAPSTAESVPPSLLRALVNVQQSFCLSDPRLPDCPIVHCSDTFMAMTGYPAHEILGRNCRFLQGPGTDPVAVAKLREDIAAGVPTTVRLLNYTKAGVPFWNSVHVAPIRDATGAVGLLIGVQVDVTAQVDREAEQAQLTAEEAVRQGGATGVGVPPSVAQMGAVGAVRVAVRALSGPGTLRRHM